MDYATSQNTETWISLAMQVLSSFPTASKLQADGRWLDNRIINNKLAIAAWIALTLLAVCSRVAMMPDDDSLAKGSSAFENRT